MKIEKTFAVMIDRFRYKIDAADTLYEKITKVTDSDLWNDVHYEMMYDNPNNRPLQNAIDQEFTRSTKSMRTNNEKN